MSYAYRVPVGERVKLADYDPDHTAGVEKEEGKVLFKELRKELGTLQETLYAAGEHSLLVVLQGLDTSGKDGTIRGVFRRVNPQGCRVATFKKPTDDELARGFLWRIHRAAPARGELVIFNRSHYEDVLVVRVKELVPESVWRERYELINNFERQLSHGGTTIIKFFLHISESEQAKRLQARLDNPAKRWKFNPDDLTERARWPAYQQAYQEAIQNTSTPHAPWHIIPSDRRWYRNWAVARVVVDTLTEMNPQYPDPPELDPHLRVV